MKLLSHILCHCTLFVGLLGQSEESETDSVDLLQLKVKQSVRNHGDTSQTQIPISISSPTPSPSPSPSLNEDDADKAFAKYISDQELTSQVFGCLAPRMKVADDEIGVRLNFIWVAEVAKLALERWEVDDGRALSFGVRSSTNEIIQRGREEAVVVIQKELQASLHKVETSMKGGDQRRVSEYIGKVSLACGQSEVRAAQMKARFLRAAFQHTEDSYEAAKAIGILLPANATPEEMDALTLDVANRSDEFAARLNESTEITEDDSDSLLHRIIEELEEECYNQLDVTGVLILDDSDECNTLFREAHRPHREAALVEQEDKLKHILALHTDSSNPDSVGHHVKKFYDNDSPSKDLQRIINEASNSTLLLKKRLLHLEKRKRDVRDAKCQGFREFEETHPQHWMILHAGLADYRRCLCRTGDPTHHCNRMHIQALIAVQEETFSKLRKLRTQYETAMQAEHQVKVQTLTLDEANRTVLTAYPFGPCLEALCCSVAAGSGHSASLCRSKTDRASHEGFDSVEGFMKIGDALAGNLEEPCLSVSCFACVGLKPGDLVTMTATLSASAGQCTGDPRSAMEAFEIGASIEVCVNPPARSVLKTAMNNLGITLCREVATATYLPFVGKLSGTTYYPVPGTHGLFSYAMSFGVKVHDITSAYANTCQAGYATYLRPTRFGMELYERWESSSECQQRLQSIWNGESYKWGIDMAYWSIGEACEWLICVPWPAEQSANIISIDGHGNIQFFLSWLWA